ncbi:general transcription factor 3C polypeptide 3-like [Clytia hemisphaerica]|uniref:general transcription factor 3C polypeptide 3-like n=1 Tax=Clytia hemisphaerica TaxID=252671 RepID=UPI0034D73ACB
MENYSANPDLMRYLQGEISFDTWLEQQGNEDETENHHTQQRAGTTPSGRPHAMSQGVSEESASVFSSWGDAFTSGAASGGGGDEQMTLPGTSKQFFNNTSGGVVEEDSDYEEDDGTETEEEVLQIGKANKSEKAKRRLITFDLQMPSFEDLPTPLESEVPSTGALTITWQELRPIIKELAVIIPTSTINKRRSKMRHRRLTEDSTGDNVPDIMKDFQDFQLRKRDSKRTPPNHHKLPELLRLQMGQANLLVAKQDFKQAADICMEIVREAPYSGLPFKTLAFIYDEQGDKEMALQYSLIYAYLDCRDSHEWIEMGRRCREADNVKQEMACYDKACKYKPWDIELQWERSLKYFAYGDYRKCLDIYFQIHKRVTPVDKITYMSCGKRIAKLYHKLGLKDKVQYSLQLAFDACDTVEDFEAVNILCEIYIENKEFINAIELIIQQCGVKIPSFVYERIKALTRGDSKRLDEFLSQSVEMTKEKFEERTNELASNVADTLKEGQETLNIMENFNTASPEKTYATLEPANENATVETSEYYCPSNLPLDLRVKLAQCLIYSNQLDFVDDIVYPLFSESIDDVGDLVLDLGEAYYDIGNYREALKYIVEVIASEKYNQAAVWLKLAEVYEHLDEMNQCIDAYYQVLHLAPLQVSIRLALASALKIVGRDEEALTVLSEYDGTRLDEDGDEVECLSESNRLKVEVSRICLFLQ